MASALARKIIAKEMPGMRIVEEAGEQDAPAVIESDKLSPKLDQMRRKYSGAAYAGNAAANRRGRSYGKAEVVLVEPKRGDRGLKGEDRLAVIIRGGKIVGAQG
jgi:hypothetical protein